MSSEWDRGYHEQLRRDRIQGRRLIWLASAWVLGFIAVLYAVLALGVTGWLLSYLV